jgi:hypothetical protein
LDTPFFRAGGPSVGTAKDDFRLSRVTPIRRPRVFPVVPIPRLICYGCHVHGATDPGEGVDQRRDRKTQHHCGAGHPTGGPATGREGS